MGGPAKIDDKLHKETDNFQRATIVEDGVEYCSVENYFQCQKTYDQSERERVRQAGPDWEEVKVQVMYQGNKLKFQQHPKLAEQLVASSGPVIFRGSTGFWNRWNGRIMELLREELRPIEEQDPAVIETIHAQMEYRRKHAV